MKKIIFLFMLFASAIATAQTIEPRLPNQLPGTTDKPLPKIKQLKKLPDLSAALVDFISASYNEESRSTSIKVSIKIVNNGTATSVAGKVAFDIYTVDFETRNPDRVHWQKFGELFDIPALAPGQTITRIATFEGEYLTAGTTYRSKIWVNPYRDFEELSVTNNQSAEFSITVR
jgi:hypothetical protein